MFPSFSAIKRAAQTTINLVVQTAGDISKHREPPTTEPTPFFGPYEPPLNLSDGFFHVNDDDLFEYESSLVIELSSMPKHQAEENSDTDEEDSDADDEEDPYTPLSYANADLRNPICVVDGINIVDGTEWHPAQ